MNCGSNPADILVDALRKIEHQAHLFSKAHVERGGKVDTGACAGCHAEEALSAYWSTLKAMMEGVAPQ